MTREEFTNWANIVANKYGIRDFFYLYVSISKKGYFVNFDGVGLPKTNDESRGFCSQIAIFEKRENRVCDESTKSFL